MIMTANSHRMLDGVLAMTTTLVGTCLGMLAIVLKHPKQVIARVLAQDQG